MQTLFSPVVNVNSGTWPETDTYWKKNKVNVNSFNVLREWLARAHLLFLFFFINQDC